MILIQETGLRMIFSHARFRVTSHIMGLEGKLITTPRRVQEYMRDRDTMARSVYQYPHLLFDHSSVGVR